MLPKSGYPGVRATSLLSIETALELASLSLCLPEDQRLTVWLLIILTSLTLVEMFPIRRSLKCFRLGVEAEFGLAGKDTAPSSENQKIPSRLLISQTSWRCRRRSAPSQSLCHHHGHLSTFGEPGSKACLLTRK